MQTAADTKQVAVTEASTVATTTNATAEVTAASTTEATEAAEVIVDISATEAALTYAASEIWAAYGAIPYVGVGLALAAIATMEASVASVAALGFAEGGVIDKPTLALMGELPGSREIVAPESTFKDWGRETLQMGASLAAAQVTNNTAVSNLNRMGASYAPMARQAAVTPQTPSHTIDARGSFFMDTLAAKRHFDKLITDSNQRVGRASG